ncbi:MAG: hypothetical protein Q9221_001458 [Calogaya cf. arnoldii]
MSPNESPVAHEASAVEIKMPVDEQTTITAQSSTYQQPAYFDDTIHQSPTPLPAHQHATSLDTTQQSPNPAPTHRYHTASLGGTPTFQQTPFSTNQYPFPHPLIAAQYSSSSSSSYYNMTPHNSRHVPIYVPSSYEHQPMPMYPQSSQALQYYHNLEGTPQRENQQLPTNPFNPRPDSYMNQSNNGSYQPSFSPVDVAGPSNLHQPGSDFSNVRNPSVRQPALPIEQPPTPTSDPLQHAQASNPSEGNTFKPPRNKTMKHLTCFYWYNYANCIHGDRCFYSHTCDGTEGVASKPIHKEPGKPAVAGKNAQKEKPDYIDWDQVHAPTNLPRPKPPLHPRVQAQIAQIHEKHSPAFSADPQERRRQEADQRAFTMRASEAAGAAAHQERLDARMKALDELVERLQGNKISTAKSPATQSTASASRSFSDPTSLRPESKAIKLDTDLTKSTVDTSTAMPTNLTATVLTDLTVENQALRSAIQDMANVVSTVTARNLDLRMNRLQLSDSLYEKIAKLPEEFQRPLMEPLAFNAQAADDSRDVEGQARMNMYAVRKKMIEMGNGGLLTAWDRDFCSSNEGVAGGSLQSLQDAQWQGNAGEKK